MVCFVSTFPPIVCGIGTYTKYLVNKLRPYEWKVLSFKVDEFLKSGEDTEFSGQVNYCLCLPYPTFPPSLDGRVLWFQHAFGMWGRNNLLFSRLIKEVKIRKKKVAASFHTIHFQSEETSYGMRRIEWELLKETLPLLDVLTVFTNGAYQAVVKAFPEYREKIVVLRHGVHLYPKVSQKEARDKLLAYLIHQANIPVEQQEELKRMEGILFSKDTVLLGNYGFITKDKDPVQLYHLGRLVQERLPNHRVITLSAGIIQRRKDKKMEVFLPILEKLKSLHDGKENFFLEHYIREKIFPLAFRALDFAVFWCHNATQSGRMAHAQGTGVCVVGRKWEGIGETLELSGSPAGETLEELAERITELVLEPKQREEIENLSRQYAEQYSFANQAKKHLLLEQALLTGEELPILDGELANDVYPREISSWEYAGYRKSPGWSNLYS